MLAGSCGFNVKRVYQALIVFISVILVCPLYAEVLSEGRVYLKKLTIVTERLDLPVALNRRIVFSDVGRNRIKDIKALDLYLDRQGHLAGIGIVYKSGVGGVKGLFIPEVKAIVFEYSEKPTSGESLLIRVVTMEEIINTWKGGW